MLMIRINRENTLAMSRRRLPALDDYFDRINLALWPRLKVRLCTRYCSLPHPGCWALLPLHPAATHPPGRAGPV
jgi:hypothetical protein